MCRQSPTRQISFENFLLTIWRQNESRVAAQAACLFIFAWFMLGRQRLFLTFDMIVFSFSAISWQFPILTAKKSAFSPYLLLAT